MTGQEFNQALRQRRRVYGTLIVSTSPRWVEAVKGTGVDFVFIDTEHVPIDRATLGWMCQAFRQAGLPPVVRIPAPDPYQACMALDGGAVCVKVPYIESAAQARELVGATKLRPFKGRRLAAFLAGERPAPEVAEYIRSFNANHSLLLNIESVAGIEALDEILAVPGIDGIVIGPHDLTCSLDVPEEYRSSAFDAATRDILARCQAAGVAAGLHVHHPDCLEDELAWGRAGATIFIHSGDISLFVQALRRDIGTLRQAFPDGRQAQGDADGGMAI